MSAQHTTNPPTEDDFIPLAEWQARTPVSFAPSQPPVLFAHCAGMTLVVPRASLNMHPALERFCATSSVNGTGELPDSLVFGVDAWVSSDNVTLFQHTPQPTGFVIPYCALALHATMKFQPQEASNALYMSVTVDATGGSGVNGHGGRTATADDIETAELKLLPPQFRPSPDGVVLPADAASEAAACVSGLFDAMNECADLHPDPDDDDDDAPAWFDSVDADGNVSFNPVLGSGAGSVHTMLDDLDEDLPNGVEYSDDDETAPHRAG